MPGRAERSFAEHTAIVEGGRSRQSRRRRGRDAPAPHPHHRCAARIGRVTLGSGHERDRDQNRDPDAGDEVVGVGRRGRRVQPRRQAGVRAVHPRAPRDRRREDLGAPARLRRLDVPEPQLPASCAPRSSARSARRTSPTTPTTAWSTRRGKSLRDLVRQRRGELGRVPDVVVRPAAEAEVTEVLRAALDADAVVIPFGGGTSISGSLEAPRDETRPVVSVDLARMDRVLEIDETSRLARVQAGVYGPRLEEQLNARGWTFGHYPDSFTHSTLGGWIATRSSGMQSDRYGDIADLTRGLRVVTPAGLLAVRPVPSTSTGPSVREMVLGSEGRLGDHLRGDRARAARAGQAHDPRLPAAELGHGARSHARSRPARPRRRSRAWPTRTRRRSRSRPRRRRRCSTRSSRRRSRRSSSAAAASTSATMCLGVHRLRGDRRGSSPPSASRWGASSPATAGSASARARRALRPEEVRHALHPRLPARPRRARRRVGDRRAVGALPASTNASSPPPAAPSRTSASGAT